MWTPWYVCSFKAWSDFAYLICFLCQFLAKSCRLGPCRNNATSISKRCHMPWNLETDWLSSLIMLKYQLNKCLGLFPNASKLGAFPSALAVPHLVLISSYWTWDIIPAKHQHINTVTVNMLISAYLLLKASGMATLILLWCVLYQMTETHISVTTIYPWGHCYLELY